MNCTLVTPTLSDALAVIETVPETVELLAGTVIATVGAVVSFTTFDTATVTVEVAVLPAASLATAEMV